MSILQSRIQQNNAYEKPNKIVSCKRLLGFFVFLPSLSECKIANF
ncbi:hypothetical protein HMPREF9296_1431 [Prevotella disiens FB035-09AN]|uniref:Uncharacterized protein n=1 Tax=Prevotella disiens FB035-09AN TaxID=866771 RepID=E1KRX2_9BACT|nr:hypothetical protein HMPREF9296_1431 [Prevotella disiens FB035-09AN]